MPRRGVSLLELVIVTTIIGVFTAIAAPRYVGALTRQRLNSAVYRVETDIAHLRERARLTSTTRTMTLDVDQDAYTLMGVRGVDGSPNSVVRLSEDPYLTSLAAFNANGDSQILFDGYGMPDAAGSISLGIGSVIRTVVLSSSGHTTVIAGLPQEVE